MKILFIGDSITDGGRDYSNCHNMGNSYPLYASQKISHAFPKIDFEFINSGIGGNRTDQLFDRLYKDAIIFQPDIISVLIGINDIWHRYGENRIETTDVQIETNYRAILERLRKQTNAKIMMISPYLLDNEDKKASFEGDLNRLLPIIRKLAEEYADVYIPLEQHFEEAMKKQPVPQYYSEDGVHPNSKGAEFIGDLYFQAITPLIEQILA